MTDTVVSVSAFVLTLTEHSGGPKAVIQKVQQEYLCTCSILRLHNHDQVRNLDANGTRIEYVLNNQLTQSIVGQCP